jgi:NADH-quinone oxidoreductase subunit N
VSRTGDARTGLEAYRGLARSRPGLALAFTVFLLAQAGIPFTSGFLAKFYVIAAAVEARSYAIAVIAMLAAVVAAFFYLRLIVVMYMADDEAVAGAEPATGGGTAVLTAEATRVEIPVAAGVAIGVALAVTLAAGLLPQPFIDLARHATLLRL